MVMEVLDLYMIEEVIVQLENELKNGLPGEKVQYRMAPEMRMPTASGLKPRLASVLILLYPSNNQLYTVFMKRPEYNGVHSGQIAFPGGKTEPSDPNRVYTALRESYEEIGIDMNSVHVIGELTPLNIPVSNIDVLPVIGFMNYKPEFNIDKNEVAYLLEISLEELLMPANTLVKESNINGLNIRIPYYKITPHEHVWGATAMILSEFLEIYKRLI